MVNGVLQSITDIVVNQPLLAPVLILIAGVITSITPCALASVPLIVGYMGMNVGMSEEEWDKKKGIKITLLYILGQVITFSVIGAIAGAVGMYLMRYMRYWYIFLGVITLVMAIEVAGITHLLKGQGVKVNTKLKGYGGAFIMGMTSGIFMSPCATPIMVLILGIVSQTGAIVKGVIYLMLYALGMGFLVLLAGISTEKVYKILNNPKYEKNSGNIQKVISVLMIPVGFYFLYKGLI